MHPYTSWGHPCNGINWLNGCRSVFTQTFPDSLSNQPSQLGLHHRLLQDRLPLLRDCADNAGPDRHENHCSRFTSTGWKWNNTSPGLKMTRSSSLAKSLLLITILKNLKIFCESKFLNRTVQSRMNPSQPKTDLAVTFCQNFRSENKILNSSNDL